MVDVAQQVGAEPTTSEQHAAPKRVPADKMGQFVSKILGSTEVVWGKIFQQSKSQYHPPTLEAFAQRA